MLNKNSDKIIKTWFDGLNQGKTAVLLPLFAENCEIKNAANPLLCGPEAPKKLLDEFFARTESREFRVKDCAQSGDKLFAAWEGILVFKTGTVIAGQPPLIAPLPVKLYGVEIFQLNAADKIKKLDIIHETASVPRYAAQQLAGQTVALPQFNTSAVDAYGADDIDNGMDFTTAVLAYFDAEQRGDSAAVVELCSDSVVIRNAANSPQYGKTGAEEYVTSFLNRTSHRNFDIKTIARDGAIYFAHFTAHIGFKAGSTFGPVVAATPFDVTLEGVCRFKLDDAGRFVELDIYHETTSALLLAKETSAKKVA